METSNLLELVDEAHDLVLLQRGVLFRELDRLHRGDSFVLVVVVL